MILKQIRIAALAATFITGSAALALAQSSSTTVGASGKAGAKATVGAGGSSSSMGNSGDTKLKGLDRADQAAGTHGQKGRDNARLKSGTDISTPNCHSWKWPLVRLA